MNHYNGFNNPTNPSRHVQVQSGLILSYLGLLWMEKAKPGCVSQRAAVTSLVLWDAVCWSPCHTRSQRCTKQMIIRSVVCTLSAKHCGSTIWGDFLHWDLSLWPVVLTRFHWCARIKWCACVAALHPETTQWSGICFVVSSISVLLRAWCLSLMQPCIKNWLHWLLLAERDTLHGWHFVLYVIEMIVASVKIKQLIHKTCPTTRYRRHSKHAYIFVVQ